MYIYWAGDTSNVLFLPLLSCVPNGSLPRAAYPQVRIIALQPLLLTPSTGYEPCATHTYLVVLTLQDLYQYYAPRSKRSVLLVLS